MDNINQQPQPTTEHIPEDYMAKPTPPKNKFYDKKCLIVIIAVLAIAGISLGSYFYFQKSTEPAVESKPPTKARSIKEFTSRKRITEISVSKSLVEGSHPKLSHDGTKIVYQRYKSGDDGLWIVNVDDSGLKKLTAEVPTGEGTFDFGWSHDDNFIFYASYGPALPVPVRQPQVKIIPGREPRPEPLTAELKIINVNTGETRTLFKAQGDSREFSIKSPTWLAQGEIAFILRDEFNKSNMSVKIVDVESGQIVEPTSEITLYFWHTKDSPESSVIASVNTTGVVTELTPGGASSVPSVGPHATKIAYSSLDGIVLMDNDGSNAELILPNLGGGAVPLFSPDGEKLIYSKSKDDGHYITESDIYMINVDGSNEQKLTTSGEKLAAEPSWSADGKKIVFFYRGDAEKQIAILEF